MAIAEDLTFDPYRDEQNPFPRWKRLRDEAPLYHNEERGFFMLTRHADVKSVLRDWRTYSSADGVVLDLMKNPSAVAEFRNMLFEDPPVHTLHRKMLTAVFTPRRVADLEPSVRELCARYLEGWGEGEYEFVSQLSGRLPMAVIGALLGVPETDYKLIADLVVNYTDRTAGEASGLAPRAALSAYLAEHIKRLRSEPADGLLSALANMRVDDGETERALTDEEAINQATVLALAGNETTNRLFSFAADTLARFPEARRELAADHRLIPGAVEEILRFENPAYFFGRVTRKEVSWHGQTLPPGSFLMLNAGSAGHDERAFESPEQFDIHRKIGNEQLGFGGGIHYCLGAPLARLELTIAIEEMLGRCPDWECDYDRAEFATTPATRGWKKLPISFDA